MFNRKIARQLMWDTGIKQTTIADKLGVKRNTVSNWINGAYTPSADNVYKLAEILGVPFEALVTKQSNTSKQKDEKICFCPKCGENLLHYY